jgi:hypothetical protein
MNSPPNFSPLQLHAMRYFSLSSSSTHALPFNFPSGCAPMPPPWCLNRMTTSIAAALHHAGIEPTFVNSDDATPQPPAQAHAAAFVLFQDISLRWSWQPDMRADWPRTSTSIDRPLPPRSTYTPWASRHHSSISATLLRNRTAIVKSVRLWQTLVYSLLSAHFMWCRFWSLKSFHAGARFSLTDTSKDMQASRLWFWVLLCINEFCYDMQASDEKKLLAWPYFHLLLSCVRSGYFLCFVCCKEILCKLDFLNHTYRWYKNNCISSYCCGYILNVKGTWFSN